jgi:hypothetical protein
MLLETANIDDIDEANIQKVSETLDQVLSEHENKEQLLVKIKK